MDEKEEHKIVLYSEWTISEPIGLDDICVSEITGINYLCSKVIPYDGFEYLYLGSFDFKRILFAIQYRIDEFNYVRILTDRGQQNFAQRLFLEKRQK